MFKTENINFSSHEEKYAFVPQYRRFILLASICNIILRTGREFAHIQAIFDYLSFSESKEKNLHLFTSMNQKDLDYLVEQKYISGSGEYTPTPKGWELFNLRISEVTGANRII